MLGREPSVTQMETARNYSAVTVQVVQKPMEPKLWGRTRGAPPKGRDHRYRKICRWPSQLLPAAHVHTHGWPQMGTPLPSVEPPQLRSPDASPYWTVQVSLPGGPQQEDPLSRLNRTGTPEGMG